MKTEYIVILLLGICLWLVLCTQSEKSEGYYRNHLVSTSSPACQQCMDHHCPAAAFQPNSRWEYQRQKQCQSLNCSKACSLIEGFDHQGAFERYVKEMGCWNRPDTDWCLAQAWSRASRDRELDIMYRSHRFTRRTDPRGYDYPHQVPGTVQASEWRSPRDGPLPTSPDPRPLPDPDTLGPTPNTRPRDGMPKGTPEGTPSKWLENPIANFRPVRRQFDPANLDR